MCRFLFHNIFEILHVDGMLKIYKSNGVGSLWSSLIPSLLLTSNPAIHYMIYERIKRKLSTRQLSALNFFLIAALSKTIATVITYPLQLIQTKMRVIEQHQFVQNIEYSIIKLFDTQLVNTCFMLLFVSL